MAMTDRLPRFEIRPLSEADGGGYLITFPDYPGCMADGETPEEAITEGRDALASYVRTLSDLARPIPSASEKPESGWAEQIAEKVRQALAERADAEGTSVGALVAKLVAEGLDRRAGSS
jgi:antitoxin HicB